MSTGIGANGQLIGEGREIVARLPNQLQKFNSATNVQNIFFTPCFSPMKCKAHGG